MANKERFVALDIFRGLTIFLMIIVNTPGNWATTYPPLLHAEWHGFTITDLVFPSFLFAVGNALAFVQKKWVDQTSSKVFVKILKRTFLLFILGYTMYWFPFFRWTDSGSIEFFPIADTRIMGVLQRIALCYLLAAILIYNLKPMRIFRLSVLLLLLYWLIMYIGGDYSMTGNIGHKLDMLIFGNNHLYQGEGVPFDPEGLLGTISSTVNVLAGYLLGIFLIRHKINFESLSKIMVVGALCLLIAYFWSHIFPINKKLWTSSYVLWTIGLDCFLIGVIIFFSDLAEKAISFNFFKTFGVNPLATYLFSEYVAILMWFIKVDSDTPLYSWIYNKVFVHFGAYFGSFLFAVLFTLMCWAVARFLEIKKIYIKV